jgi:hypothetical protein
MVQNAKNEVLITTVDGPKGSAEIYEITLPGPTIEVEYAVVFGGQRTGFPSLGEAHILANQLAGLSD